MRSDLEAKTEDCWAQTKEKITECIKVIMLRELITSVNDLKTRMAPYGFSYLLPRRPISAVRGHSFLRLKEI